MSTALVCKLDCTDDVTCDDIISYCCHASFISDNDSTLLATKLELYNKEIKSKRCNKVCYSNLMVDL